MSFLKKVFGSVFSQEGVGSSAPKDPTSASSVPKKEVKIDVVSPFDGKLLDQKEIPDEGFSEGYMGVGFGIDPTSGETKSFMSGELVVLYKTKHAYFIRDNETEISVMLHIGINTVEIDESKGAFSTSRKVNDILEAGDDLCSVNLDVVRNEGKNTISALLVQNENMEGKKIIYHKKPGDMVRAGELLMSIVSS